MSTVARRRKITTATLISVYTIPEQTDRGLMEVEECSSAGSVRSGRWRIQEISTW